MACESHNENGHRLHSSGSWSSSTTLTVQGGQAMHFRVTNTNLLGTTIVITGRNQIQQANILPLGHVDLNFSLFGAEPIQWTFQVSTNSDAFIVTWCLYSTWIPGDPPNG